MDPPDVDRDSGTARAQVAEGSQTPSKALISRRTAIRGAIGGALGGGLITLLAPQLALADEGAKRRPSLVVLLRGLYQPVVDGPDLGLSTVDLNDGSYSTTKIYAVSGIPGNKNENKAVGNFYVQFTGDLCAYHIPGGSFAMRFTGSDVVFVPDGFGGQNGKFELK